MTSSQLDLFGFADQEQKSKVDNSMQLVDDLRVSPFMPIEKISYNSKIYKDFTKNGNKIIRQTSWGKVEIRNRILTQNHLELFSLAMALKKESRKLNSGRIAIYFSIYDIAQSMGRNWSKKTSSELEELFTQIADTVIKRTDKKGNMETYHIVHKFAYSENKKMWGIVLSDEYSVLFQRGLTIGYRERLEEIRAIKGRGAGLIKSILHFFITHNGSQMHRIGLEKLLETVGYPTEERQLRTAITALNKAKDTFLKFNIVFYSKDRLFEYGGTTNIKLIPPLPSLIK